MGQDRVKLCRNRGKLCREKASRDVSRPKTQSHTTKLTCEGWPRARHGAARAIRGPGHAHDAALLARQCHAHGSACASGDNAPGTRATRRSVGY